MAGQFKFSDLKKTYENFYQPIAYMEVGGKDIGKKGYAITEVEVSLTSGFEAGMAVVTIGEVYDRGYSEFDIYGIKKSFLMGNTVMIALGYGNTYREVFDGFISGVTFSYVEDGMPCMKVTCMDIKGVMMSGNYNRHLTAPDYSGAVKEIFEKTSLKILTDNSIFNLKITDTPDHKTGKKDEVTAFSVEMVNETDYEFVVRAAKKFNYEFFCVGPNVYFRKAKDSSGVLFVLSPEWLIKEFNVEYNISGLAKTIEVRGVDPDKGEVVLSKTKLTNKISLGAKADKLIKDSVYVLQDPTVNSEKDAESRTAYLNNEISNRFARLESEFNGIPEIIPGRFMELKALTSDMSDRFYITRVTHRMRNDTGYTTRIEATAPSLGMW